MNFEKNMQQSARNYVRLCDHIEDANELEAIYEAYKHGFQCGHGLACHNMPTIGEKLDPCVDWIGLGTVTRDNVLEVHELLCHEAESHQRCFSPWEFIAHEINFELMQGKEEWFIEDLWQAYADGVEQSIQLDLSGYDSGDYEILEGASS